MFVMYVVDHVVNLLCVVCSYAGCLYLGEGTLAGADPEFRKGVKI